MSEKGKVEVLVETVVGDMRIHSQAGDRLVVRGVFGVVDKKTNNGRIYPRQVIEREIKKLQDKVKEGILYGECEHPASGKTELPRVSHRITKLALTDEGYVVGEALVLNTPAGNIVKEILLSGGKVGVSSRGLGSLAPTSEGVYIVQEDYNLITYDFVANPAVEVAVISEYDWAKINEALEYVGVTQGGVQDALLTETELDQKITQAISESESGQSTANSVISDVQVKGVVDYLNISRSLSNVSDLLSGLSEEIKKIYEEIKFNDDSLANGILVLFEKMKELNRQAQAENDKKIARLEKINNKLLAENKNLLKINKQLNEEIQRLNKINEQLLRENVQYQELAEQLEKDYEELSRKVEEASREEARLKESYLRKLTEMENFIKYVANILTEDSESSLIWSENGEINYDSLYTLFDKFIQRRFDVKLREAINEDKFVEHLNRINENMENLNKGLGKIYEYIDNRLMEIRESLESLIDKRLKASSSSAISAGEKSEKEHLRGLKKLVEDKDVKLVSERPPVRGPVNLYEGETIEGLSPQETEIVLRLAGVKKRGS